MKSLFFLNKSLFGVELMDGNRPVQIFTDPAEAVATRDTFNVNLLLTECRDFLDKHTQRLNHHFKTYNLKHAIHAKAKMQKFCTGTETLGRKGKASPVFVWHLLDEYVLHSIGFLGSDLEPYYSAYNQLQTIVKEFAVNYAPPLVEQEPQEITAGMMEFYTR